jgi:hypothetical protein
VFEILNLGLPGMQLDNAEVHQPVQALQPVHPEPCPLSAFALLNLQRMDAGRQRRKRPPVKKTVPPIFLTTVRGRPPICLSARRCTDFQ